MIASQELAALAGLADKLAKELVFAEAGTDNGLLPVNSFIIEMEEMPNLPQPLAGAIAQGRAMIDEIFLNEGKFSTQSIQRLSAWITWFESAVTAISNKQPVPSFELPSASTSPAKPAPAPAKEEENNPALLLNLPEDADLLQEFVSESREHLQAIENGALVLEDVPDDSETLNAIFRAFHTFKGGSGFLNLVPINKLAHELESLLDLARQDKIPITHEIIDIILHGGDTLKRFMDSIGFQVSGQNPHAPIVIPIAPLLKRVDAFVEAVPKEPERNFDGQTEFVRRAIESGASLAKLQPVPEPEDLPSPKPASEPVTASKTLAATSIKVDVQKLDNLVDTVGEMVIAQSLVAQDANLRALSNPRLDCNLAQLARVTRELQRTAMSLRMIPVRSTFQKMTRLVRDLSVRAGKIVNLVLSGEDTELDRNIVDELGDPLIHMMRNAVDHGIESPDVREAAGKNLFGTIHLSAFHKGGNFVVEIQDDGAGLDPERILKKALKQGLVQPTEASSLTEQEIFSLIFAPGFSTAEVVTDISGRGVGMDVVRRNIEKLRGKIEIQSTLGKGATFSIYLPLTLAIIDALIVRVGEERYIIPTLSVRESFCPLPTMLSTVHGRGEIVTVRGRHLPLLRLNQTFNDAEEATDPTEAVVIVVEADRSERCILVDELIGRQEVVIKSLGETFHTNPWLAGAAILGDGRVGLILDVNMLVNPRPQFAKAA